MTQLTVFNDDAQMVRVLKKHAIGHRQSAEAKRRYFREKSLRGAATTGGSLAQRAAAMRALLRSSIDSTFLMRRYRDRCRRL